MKSTKTLTRADAETRYKEPYLERAAHRAEKKATRKPDGMYDVELQNRWRCQPTKFLIGIHVAAAY